ncbi:MAG: ThuA domain-containing protein [Planctomycetota bacterium]|nr:ThuA domain-containing protein [Planctomycetota bacterium]
MMKLYILLTIVLLCWTPFLSPAEAWCNPPKKIVFLCAEREYETARTLPEFAREHLKEYENQFIFASSTDRNILRTHLPIISADLLVVSVRRRALPSEQLDAIRKHIAQGKPVIGIRTANHAFALRKEEAPVGHSQWPTFDQEVFGGNYTNHHPNHLTVTISLPRIRPTENSDLLDGVLETGSAVSLGSLYKVSPLKGTATVLLTGTVVEQRSEPVAWTYVRSDGGKSFYTSLGHPEDFESGLIEELLVNATKWCLK